MQLWLDSVYSEATLVPEVFLDFFLRWHFSCQAEKKNLWDQGIAKRMKSKTRMQIIGTPRKSANM